jgi:hypothetical protein
VFAVYLVPIDLWYIIPFEVAAHNKSLNLTPYDATSSPSTSRPGTSSAATKADSSICIDDSRL